MKRISLAVAAVLLVSLACSALTQVTGPDGSGPAPTILFQDDFSDPQSGWPVTAGTDQTVEYANGQYRILASKPSFDVWATINQQFEGDVRVEVDATKAGGPNDNDFGVVCHYKDDSNFYYFLLSSDGYQVIGMYLNGESKFLSSEKMQASDVIKQDSLTNHIRADCIGDTLTLYVNGQQVASTTDISLTGGTVGVIAGTFNEGGVDILFDNFVVYKP